MQYKRMLAVLLLSMAMMGVAMGPAYAATNDTNKVNNGGYTVTPAMDSVIVVSPMTVSDSIRQGETNWHSQNINGYYTVLNIDLNWGATANSLRLNIYAPDGNSWGPFYDNADGTIDGRINLLLHNSNGIAQGTWYYEVYGYSVTGTQSYTI